MCERCHEPLIATHRTPTASAPLAATVLVLQRAHLLADLVHNQGVRGLGVDWGARDGHEAVVGALDKIVLIRDLHLRAGECSDLGDLGATDAQDGADQMVGHGHFDHGLLGEG